MNDLLWLVNHPLRGNVVGISTNRNLGTLEGLESRLSVRISTELPHSTDLATRPAWKTPSEPKWIVAELLHSSYSEDSRQARMSSGPQNLTSLSILQRLNLEAP
jgi:hypothetical protein